MSTLQGYQIKVEDFRLANENFYRNEKKVFLETCQRVAKECKTFSFWNFYQYFKLYKINQYDIENLLLQKENVVVEQLNMKQEWDYHWNIPRTEYYEQNEKIADLIIGEFIWVDHEIVKFVAKYIKINK